MGERKRLSAEARKEANKTQYFAKLNDCPSSPRKMRYVADQIRGMSVDRALGILQHLPQHASIKLYKLLRSAVANWQEKNEGSKPENADLYVKQIFVDGGRALKRIQHAPQGRAHRIKKRSNHVTLIIDSKPNK